MKRLFYLIALLAFCGSIPFSTHADTASEKINAQILPTVWYSTLTPEDGASIKIYAGIQNNSNISFSGSASFFVDDKEVGTASFTSDFDTLINISTSWTADPGTHDVQVKITATLPAGKTLVAYESEKAKVKITRKIDAEVVKDTATNIINKTVSTIDTAAASLATALESKKYPETSSSTPSTSNTTSQGLVLGTSTEDHSVAPSTAQKKPLNLVQTVFNLALDLFILLLKYWKWTLGAIVLLFVILKFTGR